MYDGAGQTLKVYIDGSLINTYSFTSATVTLDFPAIEIGKPNNADAYYFHGYIDEVRISDATLSPDEFLNGNPVPEPATFFLLVSGVAAFSPMVKRRT